MKRSIEMNAGGVGYRKFLGNNWPLFAALLLVMPLLQGCTIEIRNDLFNDSGTRIQVETIKGTIVIEQGSHAIIRSPTPLMLTLNGKVLRYDMHEIPKGHLRGTLVTPTLPVCLGADLKLYIRKGGRGEQKCEHADPQPEPFPISPQLE